MQYPHDWFAKGILQGALEGVREVHIEEQVTPEVLSLDAWIDPIPGVPDDDRGLLGRITAVRCGVEPFQPNVTLDDVDVAMLRVTLLQQKLKGEAAKEAGGRSTSAPRPRLCIVSPERCRSVLDEWLCVGDESLGPGCYCSRVPTRGPLIIVVEALPRTRATLLLRLMGHGRVLQEAILHLRALPADAWERTCIDPLLDVVSPDIARRGIVVPALEGDPMIIDYKILKAEWEVKRKLIVEEGRKEGRSPLLFQFEHRLSRPLTDAERAAVSARLDVVGPRRLGEVVLTLPADALAAWLADPDAR